MKIVFIISSLEKCGPVNVLFNIIKYLDKNKFSATIITLSDEGPNTLKSEFVKLGVRVQVFKLKRNIFSLFSAKRKLENLLKEIGSDIVHTHGLRADILGALITNKYKTVSTIHNYPFEDYVMAYNKILGNIMAFLNVAAFKRIIKPVACSDSINTKFQLKLKTNYHVIQNGIDLGTYTKTNDEEKKHARLKINIDLNKKVFLFLGALIKRKDPLFVIDAFRNSPSFEDCILLVVGDGDLIDLCKETAKKYANIRIVGHVNNPEIFYKASDYYIAASMSEGLPMAVMEAFASGLPAVLSDIGPHKEVLKYNPGAGEVYNLGDKKDFQISLNKLLSSNYAEKSNAANNIIKNHLSAEIMSKNYQTLYNQMFDNLN